MIPFTSAGLAHDRVNDLLRDAEKYRLVHPDKPEQPRQVRRWRIRRAR